MTGRHSERVAWNCSQNLLDSPAECKDGVPAIQSIKSRVYNLEGPESTSGSRVKEVRS